MILQWRMKVRETNQPIFIISNIIMIFIYVEQIKILWKQISSHNTCEIIIIIKNFRRNNKKKNVLFINIKLSKFFSSSSKMNWKREENKRQPLINIWSVFSFVEDWESERNSNSNKVFEWCGKVFFISSSFRIFFVSFEGHHIILSDRNNNNNNDKELNEKINY